MNITALVIMIVLWVLSVAGIIYQTQAPKEEE